MSYYLGFWKYKEGVTHDNIKIYEQACCGDKSIDELESLPIDEILAKIASVFYDWTALDEENYEKDGKGAFDIDTTSQAVILCCSYSMQTDDINCLIDIFQDFGCPLYDPQISTRFDEWTDR